MTAAALLVLAAAGCGGDDGGGGGGGTIVHGTTDQPVSYDPAGSYDLPSWNVIYNVIPGLLALPPGGNQPEPELAESCKFDNPSTYTCTLRDGLKFSDGSDLTAEDVKASFDRVNRINDTNGPSSLFGSLYKEAGKVTGQEVEVVDDKTVTFHLNRPDSTWPFIMTTGGGGIVPSEYPPNKLQPDKQAIGAGPYKLAEYRPGEQTVLEKNDDYFGDAPKNDRVIIQYFDKSSALKLAVENGEVDIAYRNLTPTEIQDLRSADGLSVVEGNGTEIRYMVFNTKLAPGKDLAVRKAMAYVVDRQAIADNVYNGTVQPLYSMVPQGIAGHIDAFKTMYGATPNKAKATALLKAAGVKTPVQAEIWWTPSHYGDSSADEYAEIKRALDGSGLFKVQLKSTEWDQYSEAYAEDQYPIFQLGWFPDYPDPDNYLVPFYSTDNFLKNHYSNKRVDALLTHQKASTDQAKREDDFRQVQTIAAQDVPIIPLWQGKQVAAVRDGITGVDKTFDPSFQFRYWLIEKS
ncbi:MAG TPA: ABC transporter substrate-binding protein [Gaiellaceae bacterium]|nr:ABC transporter substrate-binding protein [Gaiellaceae bacterium]